MASGRVALEVPALEEVEDREMSVSDPDHERSRPGRAGGGRELAALPPQIQDRHDEADEQVQEDRAHHALYLGKLAAAIDSATPGCLDAVESASTARSSGAGPPSRWPAPSPMATNAARPSTCPLPMMETASRHAVITSSTETMPSSAIAPTEMGRAARAARAGASRR